MEQPLSGSRAGQLERRSGRCSGGSGSNCMRLKAVCMAQQCSHGIQPCAWSFAGVFARVCKTSLCRTPVDLRAASQSGAFVWVCEDRGQPCSSGAGGLFWSGRNLALLLESLMSLVASFSAPPSVAAVSGTDCRFLLC